MKKTLSILAILGIVATAIPSAEAAFNWSKLNPWSKCNKCQKYEQPTGYATPCDPCAKKKKGCPCKVQQTPCEPCQKIRENCDPCDRLQEMNR